MKWRPSEWFTIPRHLKRKVSDLDVNQRSMRQQIKLLDQTLVAMKKEWADEAGKLLVEIVSQVADFEAVAIEVALAYPTGDPINRPPGDHDLIIECESQTLHVELCHIGRDLGFVAQSTVRWENVPVQWPYPVLFLGGEMLTDALIDTHWGYRNFSKDASEYKMTMGGWLSGPDGGWMEYRPDTMWIRSPTLLRAIGVPERLI